MVLGTANLSQPDSRVVSGLNEKRAQFLSAFDGPGQRSIRQQAHHEWYLMERERA